MALIDSATMFRDTLKAWSRGVTDPELIAGIEVLAEELRRRTLSWHPRARTAEEFYLLVARLKEYPDLGEIRPVSREG